MLEINCKNCRNFLNEVDGCKRYGSDPVSAAKACVSDGFKNAVIKPKRVDRDKETYFRAEFYCPVCGTFLTSYTYGREWTENGLADDKQVDCPCCDQMIDWVGVPGEDGTMQWVTVEGTHINTNNVQSFFCQRGRLLINLVGASTTLKWDDPDRELYLALCRQLGIRPDEEDGHE